MPPPSHPRARTPFTVRYLDVSAALAKAPDTERALADEAAAKDAGFSLKPPVYAIGTAVNATGERNFRQSRREFEALPFATDACGDLAARVEAERRCDTLVDAPSLNMLADGRLASELGSLPISERALEGLSRLVTPGGAGYLTECPSGLRATNVNHWLARATRCDRNGDIKPRQLTLRARQTATNHGAGCEEDRWRGAGALSMQSLLSLPRPDSRAICPEPVGPADRSRGCAGGLAPPEHPRS